MSDLEVPVASHEAASKMRRDLVDYEDLQAIAKPIVIAELRRLTETLEFPPDRVKLICRADELEAES